MYYLIVTLCSNLRAPLVPSYTSFVLQTMILTGITLLLWPQLTAAITVYDCDSPTAQVQVVDLLEPAPCPDPVNDYEEPEPIRAQVLQVDSTHPVVGYQCLAVVSRMTAMCAFDSFLGVVEWPIWQDKLNIDPQACRQAVIDKEIVVDGKTIKFTPGTSQDLSYTSHGAVDKTGSRVNRCTAAAFTRAGKYFNSHYETTLISVTITPVTGLADLATGQVNFNNGIRTNYMDLVARDSFLGTIVWSAEPTECEDSVSEVYFGKAEIHKRRDPQEDLAESIIMIRQEQTGQFAGLVVKKPRNKCGMRCHTTQISGILICLFQNWEQPARRLSFKSHFDGKSQNVQSQIAFLHITSRLQMYERFTQFSNAMCELERGQLRTKLQALSGGDNAHALLDLYGPGHSVLKGGLAAYVVKCKPVEAAKAEFPNCTTEIPVIVGNQTKFADPFSLILQELPTVLPCSDLMPVRWKLHGRWYCSHPKVVQCAAPMQINHSITARLTEQEEDPRDGWLDGLGHGLYTQQQLDDNRRFRAMIAARSPVAQRQTNNAAGALISDGTASSLFRLPVGEEETQQLINLVGENLLPGFWLFGRGIVYFQGILFTVVIIKVVLSILFRAIHIYRRKGCGWWMVASLWDVTFTVLWMPFSIIQAAAKAAIDPQDGVSERPRCPELGHATSRRSGVDPELKDQPGDREVGDYRALLEEVAHLRRLQQSLDNQQQFDLGYQGGAAVLRADSLSQLPVGDTSKKSK